MPEASTTPHHKINLKPIQNTLNNEPLYCSWSMRQIIFSLTLDVMPPDKQCFINKAKRIFAS
jgi:hypothetical protein